MPPGRPWRNGRSTLDQPLGRRPAARDLLGSGGSAHGVIVASYLSGYPLMLAWVHALAGMVVVAVTSIQPAYPGEASAELAPITRLSLSEQVARNLLRFIDMQPILPGEALPSQGELAMRFAVSRPTVREALR